MPRTDSSLQSDRSSGHFETWGQTRAVPPGMATQPSLLGRSLAPQIIPPWTRSSLGQSVFQRNGAHAPVTHTQTSKAERAESHHTTISCPHSVHCARATPQQGSLGGIWRQPGSHQNPPAPIMGRGAHWGTRARRSSTLGSPTTGPPGSGKCLTLGVFF